MNLTVVAAQRAVAVAAVVLVFGGAGGYCMSRLLAPERVGSAAVDPARVELDWLRERVGDLEAERMDRESELERSLAREARLRDELDVARRGGGRPGSGVP